MINWNNFFWGKKVLVVAHDAGAANHICSILKRVEHTNQIDGYFSGPAKTIFSELDKKISILEKFPADFRDFDFLFVGTGWQSNQEVEALYKAKSEGIQTIALVDNYVNYQERFILNGELVYPQAIVVLDDYSERLARQLLPSFVNIFRTENYYIQDIVSSVAQKKRILNNENKNKKILVILQPLDILNQDISRKLIFQKIKFFLDRIELLRHIFGDHVSYKIRPHPSDIGVDSELVNLFVNIKISKKSLVADLAWANMVVGFSSYALVVSTYCMIETISLMESRDDSYILKEFPIKLFKEML